MKIAFYLNCISMHQLPLIKEVSESIGVQNCVCITQNSDGGSYQTRGIDFSSLPFKVRLVNDSRELLETVEVVFTGIRDLELIEKRAKKGLKTFYTSERWFKPIPLRGVKVEGWLLRVGEWNLPGCVRMLIPSYRRMVKRFVRWANSDPGAKVLAIGPWAKQDFLRMGVRAEKIVDWGYFVAPSKLVVGDSCSCRMDALPLQLRTTTLKVLWVGRMVEWKRVGDIERAVALANDKIVVGDSCSCRMDDKESNSALPLQLQTTTKPITFTKLTGVPLAEVRKAMQSHDVYVLASSAYEGWGAALNEALEEGMNAIGTFEAGASAAMLPKERLYHAGDVKALARLLELEVEGMRLRAEGREPILPPCSIGDWTAKAAAQRLVELV